MGRLLVMVTVLDQTAPGRRRIPLESIIKTAAAFVVIGFYYLTGTGLIRL